MWNVMVTIGRLRTLALAAAILSPLPLAAQARLRHIKWEDLSTITGRTVRVPLPGGSITGKAVTVEGDALVVDVQKTTDSKAYPNGTLRVRRTNLHRLEMQSKGKFFRVGGTIAAGLLAVPLAYAVGAYGVDHCNFWSGYCPDGHTAGGVAATVGISAASITGAYFAGNALDTRWTVIEIVP
jgi:hypothetical protein